jgi:hypothetical protein
MYKTAAGNQNAIKFFIPEACAFYFRSWPLVFMALLFNSVYVLRPVNIVACCCAINIFMGHFVIQFEN